MTWVNERGTIPDNSESHSARLDSYGNACNDPEEMKHDYANNVPLRRMGEPDKIREMVAFLASDAAKFITGQRITINGGNTMV